MGRTWRTRFEGGEIGSTGLDVILYEDEEEVRAARISKRGKTEREK